MVSSAARPSAPFPTLGKAQYISLTTFRKNGEGVPTPVWFVAHDGKLYVQTEATAGKLKRLRNNSRVTLAPCTAMGKVTGAVVNGQAHPITDPTEAALAESLLAKRYGLLRIGLGAMLSAMATIRRQPHAEPAYIAIEPAG